LSQGNIAFALGKVVTPMRQLWLKLGTLAFWICWPVLYVYLRRSQRTRVVVRAGGQVLLVRSWLSDGQWGLPGGGMHRGESPALGAARELREETGLEVSADGLMELATESLAQHGLRFTCTFFLADIDKTGVFQTQRGEIIEAQWFHMADVTAPGFQPEVKRALKLLVAKGLF